MEFFDLIKERRSIRKFAKKKVEEEKILKILEACNLAPSAGNLQSYEIIIVKDENIKKKLAEASHKQRCVSEADFLLVFFANPKRAEYYGERGRKLYSIQDATISCSFACLAATNLGLGSVWIGAFDEEKVKEILNAPKYLIPVAILPIGYAAESPKARERRDIEELAKVDNFKEELK